MISNYPLQWPEGWKRTLDHARKNAQFRKQRTDSKFNPATGRYDSRKWVELLTVGDGVKRVLDELESIGIERGEVIISTNVPVRLDGLPKSGAARPADPGAAVYWRVKGGEVRCMAVDRYTEVADNLAALAATLEAMRAIERHGGAEILNRAFRGFKQLPAGPASWVELLGFTERVGQPAPTAEEINDAFRAKAKIHHPDVGGDPEKFKELSAARDRALAEIGELLSA